MDRTIQEFLDYLTAERGSSDNTIAAYRNDLTQFQEYMGGKSDAQGDQDWSELTRDDLIDYILWLKEREYASATVARKVAAMKSFCAFLLRTGVLEENPAEDLDSPKVKKQLPTTLTPEEVDLLLAQPLKAGPTPKALRDSALLEVLYATGMRVSEIAGLTLDDIDLHAQTVRCMGKGSKERVMPLYNEATPRSRGLPGEGPARAARSQQGRAHPVSQPARGATHPAGSVAHHQGLCQAARAGGSGYAAHAAPFVRHTHAERRRGAA